MSTPLDMAAKGIDPARLLRELTGMVIEPDAHGHLHFGDGHVLYPSREPMGTIWRWGGEAQRKAGRQQDNSLCCFLAAYLDLPITQALEQARKIAERHTANPEVSTRQAALDAVQNAASFVHTLADRFATFNPSAPDPLGWQTQGDYLVNARTKEYRYTGADLSVPRHGDLVTLYSTVKGVPLDAAFREVAELGAKLGEPTQHEPVAMDTEAAAAAFRPV